MYALFTYACGAQLDEHKGCRYGKGAAFMWQSTGKNYQNYQSTGKTEIIIFMWNQ